jgi:hypothetical protein
VYVIRQELDREPIVKWLNTQRLTDGGWATTQDTVWVMKALKEYTDSSKIRNVSNIDITVEATSLPGESKRLSIKGNNRAKLQTINVRIILIYSWYFYWIEFYDIPHIYNSLIKLYDYFFRYQKHGER